MAGAFFFRKEHLGWYLITLKLRQTVEARIHKTPTPTTSAAATRSIAQKPPVMLLQRKMRRCQSQFASKPKTEHSGEAKPSAESQYLSKLKTEHSGGAKSSESQFASKLKTEHSGGLKLSDSDWVINIREKLKDASQDDVSGTWAKLSIYRLPDALKEDDKISYHPQTVSLGPYHHGKKRLRGMDRHKWRGLNHVLKRTNQDIELYLNSIREVEQQARACYEGQIYLSSNEFVEMMVLDGCFILELFQGATGGFRQLGYSRNDPIFAMRGSMHSIQRDMIMLENQLPLFILNRLLGFQYSQPDQRGLVAKLVIRFFDPLMPTDVPLSKSHRNWLETSLLATFDPLSDHGGLHCLDVFRRSLLKIGSRPEPRVWIKQRSTTFTRVADKRRQQLIHCVTELSEAGVKFRKRKTPQFWDVKFENGTLKLPRILIHEGTMSLFLNLIAFEQCHLESSNDITSYVIFMNNLINSPADVAYLHYHGIIEHWLGSDAEVAELFHYLCKEVVFDINSYLSELSEQVNRYYNYRWNAWRASLRHNYFNNPWAIISFFAAVVLLILTFAQTFYGVYGYYSSLP